MRRRLTLLKQDRSKLVALKPHCTRDRHVVCPRALTVDTTAKYLYEIKIMYQHKFLAKFI